MTRQATLSRLAKEHGTPLFVVDHDILRENYRRFRQLLPDVQAYYAVKANPDPAIVKTFYDLGCSFDVASLPEFRVVHQNIQALPTHERQAFIWDKIIYANPIKANETLEELDYYGPLVTYDNLAEVGKIQKLRAPCRSGIAHRRTQYWRDGRSLDEVWRGAWRGGRSDRRGLRRRTGGRRHQLPRRQPDDQLRQFRAGLATGGGCLSRGRCAASTSSICWTLAAAFRPRTTQAFAPWRSWPT